MMATPIVRRQSGTGGKVRLLGISSVETRTCEPC